MSIEILIPRVLREGLNYLDNYNWKNFAGSDFKGVIRELPESYKAKGVLIPF
jgi:hypothetical protein